jgi:dolichol-phosphate mannosyltransferase
MEAEKKQKLISVVMPVYNEEVILPEAHRRVTEVMSALALDYEVLLIDNDSTDRTPEIAADLCRRDPRWKYLKFSRNFLAETSLAAGMRYAVGDAVVFLFSDLQDPPEVIPEFVTRWEQGYDVVYGIHRQRHGDPWWRNQCAALVYWLINRISEVQIPAHAGDFRLLDRKVVDVLNRMDERSRYLRGMGSWVGFRSAQVLYDRAARAGGESKAPLWAVFRTAMTGLVSFSVQPLYMLTLLGCAGIALALALGTFTFVAYYVPWIPKVPGLSSLHCIVLFHLGFTSLGFGLLGEYIGRIFLETKRRPLWIVEKTINLDIPPERRIGGLF